jgi:hypothetical protein
MDEPIDNAEDVETERVLPEALVIGQEFATFQDFKAAIG